jgi:uncharacterized membrane protein YbaN (DUF454 family)
LPTVPFVILPRFASRARRRGSRLAAHTPAFGQHIVAWREKGAISRKGKIAATAAFAVQHRAGGDLSRHGRG